MNNRRKLVLLLGSGALVHRAAFAQSKKRLPVIGYLGPGSPSGYVREWEAIRKELRALGYIEGTNISIEYRWAEGNAERLKVMAAELVARKVDILLTHAIPGARAAMQATTTIPIVIADVADPVAAGLIASYAHPGGNLTGSTSFQVDIHAKRLELLKEIVPRINRVGVLMYALNPVGTALYRKSLEEAGRRFKVEFSEFAIREQADLAEAFGAMAKMSIDAAVIGEDPLLNSNVSVIAALALTHRIPTVGLATYADAGGLLAYGADRPALYGRAAYFIDRIIKGSKVGDIPYERATKFDLIVNLKTAKALGVTIPPEIMVQATRVIR